MLIGYHYILMWSSNIFAKYFESFLNRCGSPPKIVDKLILMFESLNIVAVNLLFISS
jgi:hypothetical protein